MKINRRGAILAALAVLVGIVGVAAWPAGRPTPAFEIVDDAYRVVVDTCGSLGAVGTVENRLEVDNSVVVVVAFLVDDELVHTDDLRVRAPAGDSAIWSIPYQSELADDPTVTPTCEARVRQPN